MPSLIVSPGFATIEIGELGRSFVANDETGRPISEVQWSIDPPIAKIHNENGEAHIEGTQAGRAVITATTRGRTASAVISIVPEGTFLSVHTALPSSSIGQVPAEEPTDLIPQHTPCLEEPITLKALRTEFSKGRVPLPKELTGSWVLIGFFEYDSAEILLNCTGVTRGIKFESVLLATGYSVDFNSIGITYPQTVKLVTDRKGSLKFPVDFDGDRTPWYRCRLTERKTLVCLVDEYSYAEEYKKMPVEEVKIPRPEPHR